MPGMKPTPGKTAIHEAASICGALAAGMYVQSDPDVFAAFKLWVLTNGDDLGLDDQQGRESFKDMTRPEYTAMVADAREIACEMVALAVHIRAREVTAQQN